MTQVIFSTGDKGGTGKSTTARFIVELLLGEGKKVQLIDCDPNNPDLIGVFGARESVLAIDVRHQANVDELFQIIEGDTENTTFVLDMPAGAGEYLSAEADFFAALFDNENINLDIVWSLNTDKTGVVQLKANHEAFAELGARYTVVKNGFYAQQDNREDPFAHWNGSAIKKTLEKTGRLHEVELPGIRKELMEGLGRRALKAEVVDRAEGVPSFLSARWAPIYKKLANEFSHLTS